MNGGIAIVGSNVPAGAKVSPGGAQGIIGLQGERGDTGTDATVSAGTTTTGAPGTQAQVTERGTTQNRIFDFTIPRGDVGPSSIVASESVAPIMLAAVNGAVCLTGDSPTLLRLGNTVFLTYQGSNKNSNTANTISLAEIPVGYRPTANFSDAIVTPGVNIIIQIYTTGTNVFSDNPGTNVLAGNTRWSLRASAQLGANATVSMSLSWQTNDSMP